MTVKELFRIYQGVEHCKIGYCCYQDDNKSKYDLLELGYNRGVYGWNWTAYLDTKQILCIFPVIVIFLTIWRKNKRRNL